MQYELIDTLWNVNCFSAFLFCFGAAELIDTLWNVNGKQVTKGRMLDFRINRYIMECKR